jgi:hypothetical protein
MTPVYPGHLYILDHLDGSGKTELQFVQRPVLHEPKEGVTNQEVLRAVIDRVKYLNTEVPWFGNSEIIYHLRMAIALHESRAITRRIKKHGFAIESAALGADGHLLLSTTDGVADEGSFDDAAIPFVTEQMIKAFTVGAEMGGDGDYKSDDPRMQQILDATKARLIAGLTAALRVWMNAS